MQKYTRLLYYFLHELWLPNSVKDLPAHPYEEHFIIFFHEKRKITFLQHVNSKGLH